MDNTLESKRAFILSGGTLPTSADSGTLIPWKLTRLCNVWFCDFSSKSKILQLSSKYEIFPNFFWTPEPLFRVEMRINFCSYSCKMSTNVFTIFSSEVSKPCSQSSRRGKISSTPCATFLISNTLSSTLLSESQSTIKTSLHLQGQIFFISLLCVIKHFIPINNEFL